MSAIIVILFLGGWLLPFHTYLYFLDGAFFFFIEIIIYNVFFCMNKSNFTSL